MKKRKYKCASCGTRGAELVFEFTDDSYCVASNDEDPEYVDSAPQWVADKGVGSAEIGEPVGCLKCQAWGVSNFEEVS